MSRPQSISVILVAAIGLVSALRVSGAQQADEAIPDLGLPSGATGNGKSGSNGEGFSQSVIWIATNQTVGDVAGYYRRKLAEIGWRHSGDFTGKDLMVSRFASVAGTAATVGTLGVMPLNSGQIVVWVRRVRSLPPNASSGRVGGGGASMTGGEKATVGPPIDIAVRTLFGMAPTAPGGEQMAALQAVPAAFPKELIHPRFVASRIVGSPSRTTIAGVIQNAASPDATVLMSGAKK